MKLFKVIETSYNNFDNTIRSYLSKTLGIKGQEYSKSNIFGVIFEGIKAVLQNMSFYIEDAFSEQNVDTAIRKKSIYSLAKISGYEPFYGSAASGTILVNNFVANDLPEPGTKVYLRNGAVLNSSTTGLNYILYLPIDYYVFDLAKPLVSHEMKVIQGNWVNDNYTAKGEAFEAIEIAISSLFDRDYIEVTVDSEKYDLVANIYEMVEDGKECVLSVGYEGGMTFIFGNGVHGKKLINGQHIEIKYLAHNGSLGNIEPSQNNSASAFTITEGCYDGYGNKIDASRYLKISILNNITGGTNSDTIDNVRNMIGYNSRSLVLASEDNFKLFLKRFSFIGHTNIWSEPNSLSVMVSALSNKKESLTSPSQYFELDGNELLLTEDQKNMVLTTLSNSNKSFAGINLSFEDPRIANYSIICYAKTSNKFNEGPLETSIKNTIASYFMSLDSNTMFIPKSDIIKKVLDEIEELESFDIEIISKDNEDAYKNGYYYIDELKFINGTYQYKKVKKIYDGSPIGLDDFGNINITSKLQVPHLHGNFKFYYDKSKRINVKKNLDNIQCETVSIIWI